MTIEELIRLHQKSVSVRKHHNDEEHRIQVACVRWFRAQYRDLANLLFAIPNGGRRDKATAARLKDEGVVAGVADLALLLPSKGCHGLFIEMKTAKGRQSESQKQWQRLVVSQRYKYVVCRSLSDFKAEVENYMR